MKKPVLRDRVVEQTAKASGVTKRTVTNIHASMTQDKQFLTPIKRYTASRVCINPDTFDKRVSTQHF